MSFFAEYGQEFNLVVFSDLDNLDVSNTTSSSSIVKAQPKMRALGAVELMLRQEQLLSDSNMSWCVATGLFYDTVNTIVPDSYSFGSAQLLDGVYFIRRVVGGSIYIMAA